MEDFGEALDFCDELLTDLDELPERAEDFRDSVREKVESIRDWVEEHETITERQAEALRNIRAGVDKWLRR